METGNRQVPVRLRFFGFPDGEAVLVVTDQSGASRVKRALVTFAAGFGLALLGALIPIAHFVLVPGFLIGALLLAGRRLRETVTLRSVEGTCPRCGNAQSFAAHGRWRGRARVQCAHCSNTIEVEALDQPAT